MGAWVRSTYWKNADLEWLSWVVRFSASWMFKRAASFDDDVLNRLFEIATQFIMYYSERIISYSRDWNELSSPPRITKLINGCVALPWHFEFYILKCKIFLINFLYELGNFKQKNFTLQHVKKFYILKCKNFKNFFA